MIPLPNWEYWCNLVDVELSEAAALSCNVSHDVISGDQSGAEKLALILEVTRRIDIAYSHIAAGKLATTKYAVVDGKERPFVTLSSFRTWGESLPRPFTFPSGFPQPTATAEPEPSSGSPVAADVSKPLRSDARENLLRVILALYEKSSMAEREVVGTVSQMIESLGFDGPREDTVRTIINQARALLVDHPRR